MEDLARLRRDLDRATRHLAAMTSELASIGEDLSPDDWLLARARLGTLTADFNSAIADVDEIQGTIGARSRILRYLQLQLGETVSKEELSGVAGIHEWARRLRELRQDFGWDIHSAMTREGLGVGEYVLMQAEPDLGLARAWGEARRMRKLRTAGGTPPPKIRVLEFLKAIHPRCADNEQLAHVAGSTERAERAIEDLILQSWAVVKCFPSGPASQASYRLDSLSPASH